MTETKSNDSENNANIQPTQQPSNTKNGRPTVIHFIEMLSVPTAGLYSIFVDTDSSKGPESIYTIPLLKLIKEAQQQHGLRHGDYQRYRTYCSSRLHR